MLDELARVCAIVRRAGSIRRRVERISRPDFDHRIGTSRRSCPWREGWKWKGMSGLSSDTGTD